MDISNNILGVIVIAGAIVAYFYFKNENQVAPATPTTALPVSGTPPISATAPRAITVSNPNSFVLQQPTTISTKPKYCNDLPILGIAGPDKVLYVNSMGRKMWVSPADTISADWMPYGKSFTPAC